MKNAIQRAIEGGYRSVEHNKALEHCRNYGREFLVNMYYAYVTNDPLFWQSLGKAEGWKEQETRLDNFFNENMNWKYYWHRFVDHLIAGKDTDSFFDNLLTNK